jgi:hypothetical protein
LGAGLILACLLFSNIGQAAGRKVQANDPATAALLKARGAQLIGDYGSYQLYRVSSTSALALPAGAEARDEYDQILLNAVSLNTTEQATLALHKALGLFSGKRLHLIHFAGPVLPSWHDALLKTGVQIVTYIPHNAYLVYGDAPSLARLQSMAATAPHVQWEAEYADDYKMDPAARTTDSKGALRDVGTDDFAIQLIADQPANDTTIQLLSMLRLAPFSRHQAFMHYINIVARVLPADLAKLAARPDVISIQPYFKRQKFDERQDQIVAGNLTGTAPSGPGYLAWLASKGFTLAQFTNSGFAADITDSGLDNGTTSPGHAGLYTSGLVPGSSRVIYNRLEGSPNSGSTIQGCDGHGTLNSHIIMGYDDQAAAFPHADAAGYHYGLGVCPFIKIGSSVIFDPDTFTFPDYTALQSRAYNNGARVSNNSWGANTAGAYDIDCQEYDRLVRDAQPSGSPFPAAGNQETVIVFAAGNAGPSRKTVGAPGSAKNVITVGASENVQAFGGNDGCGVGDSVANSADDIAFFSSRGPCADGRHKPELVAPGTHVSGGVAQAAGAGPNGSAIPCFDAAGVCGLPGGVKFYPVGQELFTVSTGTSHSTPCVVGGCALLRQYFINNFNGPPSAAMTKAYLMNSTRYLTGAAANDNLWSDNQGMGEMNLGTAFDGASRVLRDQLPADLFTASGQTRVFTGMISDSTKPFRVTVAWTDAPGATSGNAYKNNLDLVVTIGGNTYKGNVFSSSNSITGGTADSKNNSESVILPAGLSGTFTVTINGVNINSDGVPGNSSPIDQDFALVIYNAALISPPTISSINPSDLVVLAGKPAAFNAVVNGTPPLSYRWYLNGSLVAGATSNVLSIASATAIDAGTYSLSVTNAYGSATNAGAHLTVIPNVPLNFALNNSNLVWTVDDATPWYGQVIVSHDGQAAAQSWGISDSQQSSLRSSVTGPGTLSFFWRVSSEAGADLLTFTLGETDQASLSGDSGWEQQTFYLTAGPQSLQWTYGKNSTASAGADAAWVDQVAYSIGPTIPFMITQPASAASVGGSPVGFSASAAGTPALSYQWLHEGVPISGATDNSLTINLPQPSDAGAYALKVSNGYGFVISSNAVLGVVPLSVNGDNSLGQITPSFRATNAVAIAAGDWHTLALSVDGSVLAWGNDANGQCDIPGDLNSVISIAAGGYHSLALKLDGTVAGWGANDDGQALAPSTLKNAVEIAAGSWHSLALRSDGTVVAWGDNSWGQTTLPPGLGNVVAIAAGGNHSLALRADGTVVAWGENTDSQGSFIGQSIVPPGLANVVGIHAGTYHSLAVKSDGTLAGWGDNSFGQLTIPAGVSNIIAAVGGGSHTLALLGDGTVRAWGDDNSGQCEVSTTLTNITALAAGSSHSVLLLGNRAARTKLIQPVRSLAPPFQKQFRVLTRTMPGQNYAFESADSLAAGSSWRSLAPAFRGDGNLRVLKDTNAPPSFRFYRVRQF